MKKLTLIFTLLFSTVMFSLPSYAGLTKISENVDGDIYYVDFERIRKHDGYVYFWWLRDYLKPDEWGGMSNKVYYEIDCKAFRRRSLTYIFYNQPMGEGEGETDTPDNPEWQFPSPDSMNEFLLNKVCAL